MTLMYDSEVILLGEIRWEKLDNFWSHARNKTKNMNIITVIRITIVISFSIVILLSLSLSLLRSLPTVILRPWEDPGRAD